VAEDEAEKWCSENGGYDYFEVSAKDATNVDNAFGNVALGAYRHQRSEIEADEAAQGGGPQKISLGAANAAPPAEQDSGCC